MACRRALAGDYLLAAAPFFLLVFGFLPPPLLPVPLSPTFRALQRSDWDEWSGRPRSVSTSKPSALAGADRRLTGGWLSRTVRPMDLSAANSERRQLERLPGWEIVSAGLEDLSARRLTVPAMLVASASERLREVGIAVPAADAEQPSWTLYELIVAEIGEAPAHGRYNALRRRLASFLRAASSATRD
jgi:hypothetical protein